MTGRRVAKRACDGCKIRKIKCSELSPCDGCVAAGIACTFVKHPSARGPRKLRNSTLQEIRQTQQQWASTGLTASIGTQPSQGQGPGEESAFNSPSKIASLVLQLCVYRLRMYPVWPIIKVERLVASLQKPDPDVEVFALAYAVAAATIAQIRTPSSSQTEVVTAEMMEAQCQRARANSNMNTEPNVTTARIAFFLHIFYENQKPGGVKSILYLREAITLAQIIGIHRESYYANVPYEEQQIRRRTFWLLFVTERGVSILHSLPVIIKSKIDFPSTEDTDERDVLVAFQKLIGLFWTFDQSGIFDTLDNANFDVSKLVMLETGSPEALDSLQRKLSQFSIESGQVNDIQTADIAVTRQWMRVILWRLSRSHGYFSESSATSQDPAVSDPIKIASDLLVVLSNLPNTAIEAHGPGLELKIFEIASSVVDAMSLEINTRYANDQGAMKLFREVLAQLQRLLSRNKKLDSMLREKILSFQQNRQPSLDFSQVHSNTNQGQSGLSPHIDDLSIQQELQTHGFFFSEPTRASASPRTDSITSDLSYHSPDRNPNQMNLPSMTSPGHSNPHEISQQATSQTGNWNTTQDTFNQVTFDPDHDQFNDPNHLHDDLEAFNYDVPMSPSAFANADWATLNSTFPTSGTPKWDGGF